MGYSKTGYEWTINDCVPGREGPGFEGEWDILDNDFADSLSHYSDADAKHVNGKDKQLELRKFKYDPETGDRRLYNFADCAVGPDGLLQLDAEFNDGTKVPAKFFKELAAFNKRRAKIILSPR